jgi:hypothetical protein
MADVKHINRLIGNYEEETICAAISFAEKQMTDGFAK